MGPPRCHCQTSYHHHHHPYHHHHHQYLHASIATSTTQPLRLLLLLCLLYGFALASVSGFSLQKSSQCQIDQCYDQYKDALELAGGVGEVNPLGGGGGAAAASDSGDNEARCVALRTYWSCIKTTKNSSRGCQGNIHYYSVRNVLRNQLKQYNCTMHGPTVDPASTSSSSSSSSSSSKQVPPPPRQVPEHCRYHGPKVFQHCGLFGDPHLRTFNNQFQTCKVKGAWPLVNNEYLIVQVTNDPVLGGEGDATATSKLTVIVKSHGECGSDHYHTYQAQTDSLPSAFEDGNTSIGPHAGVQVVEVEANRHVEIHVHYIATTIVVRQIGRYFTFAIHMPQQLVNASQHRGRGSGEPELCSKGCPASEQINYQQYLAQRRHTVTRIQSEASGPQVAISRYEAEEVCRDSGLVDFYFDSCVFDLMATGDKNFTLAALSALKDVLRLEPAMAPLANRTSLQPYDSAFGAAPALSRTVSCWWHVLCALSLCLTLWQRAVVVVR